MKCEGTTSTVFWNFKDTIGGTKVTWRSKGKMSFLFKIYSALQGGADNVIGTIYEKSLANLDKALDYEINTFSTIDNGIVQKPVMNYIGQTFTSELSKVNKNFKIVIPKLTTFCESKGLSVEFKGGLFAANIQLKELYEKNELISWQQTKKVIYDYIDNALDYTIEAANPSLYKDSIWKVPLTIKSKFNPNFKTSLDVLYDFMKASTMNTNEAKDYTDLEKKVFPLIIGITEIQVGINKLE